MAITPMEPGAKKLNKIKASTSSTTGKSKVISTGSLNVIKGGNTRMFGQQSVKAAKSR